MIYSISSCVMLAVIIIMSIVILFNLKGQKPVNEILLNIIIFAVLLSIYITFQFYK